MSMQRTPPPCSIDMDLKSGANVTTRHNKRPRTKSNNSSLEQSPEKSYDMATYKSISPELIRDIVRTELHSFLKTDIRKIVQESVRAELKDIKSELNCLRSEYLKLESNLTALDAKHETTVQDVISLQKSLQFASDQQDDLKKQLNSLSKQSTNTEVLHDTIVKLEVKIDSLEQQARQCNLELCNIPEKRAENLITLMETISAKLNCPLSQKDIIAIHRVPHAQKQNHKPKNVIVKLSSRILRDNLLSAFRLAKGLKTDLLGIPGTPQPIYMNEHLTLKNKQLFRACREAAAKNKFKFVWVKHATILVRENDGASAIAIRSQQDILKIKSGTSKHNNN